MPRRPLATRVALLGALYLVQGLPFGFQAIALPVMLRRQGIGLEEIGFAGALAAPWMLKLVWAPAVDAYHVGAIGRRRSWILPLQLGLALSCGAAAFVDPEAQLGMLLGLVLAMNLFAATLDVAVDGLAVDLLDPSELGPGNIAQVVGFKLGMLTTGGLMLAYLATLGWPRFFFVMAGLVVAVLVVTLVWREPEAPAAQRSEGIGDVWRAARRAVRLPGAGWVLAFIATYKLGEAAADAMFKPFLVDEGFGDDQIGLWVGTWGTVASLTGSVAGGLLARRLPLLGAVALTAALRALPVAGQWALAAFGPTAAGVIAVTTAEHFFGGALTTAMFAFMMSRVDRRIGATHYTALATVEVLGKAPAGILSGVLARAVGYPGVFAIATLLSVAFLGLLFPVRRAISAPGPGSRDPRPLG